MSLEEIKNIKYCFILAPLLSIILIYMGFSSIKIVSKENVEVANLVDVLSKFKDYSNYGEFIKSFIPSSLSELREKQTSIVVNNLILKLEANDIIVKCDSNCTNSFVDSFIKIEMKKINFSDPMTIEDIEKEISGMDCNARYVIGFDFSQVDFKKLPRVMKISHITAEEEDKTPEGYVGVVLNALEASQLNINNNKEKTEYYSFKLKAEKGYAKIKIKEGFLRRNYEIIKDNWSKVRKFTVNELIEWAKKKEIEYNSLSTEKDIMGISVGVTTTYAVVPILILLVDLFFLLNIISLYTRLKNYCNGRLIKEIDSNSFWIGIYSVYITITIFIISFFIIPITSLRTSLYFITKFKIPLITIPFNISFTMILIFSSVSIVFIWMLHSLARKKINQYGPE